MYQKISLVLDQVRVLAVKVLSILVAFCGIAITTDLLLKTKFFVLSRLARMTGFDLKTTAVVGLVTVFVYMIVKK